jgi:hypothetical protein
MIKKIIPIVRKHINVFMVPPLHWIIEAESCPACKHYYIKKEETYFFGYFFINIYGAWKWLSNV